MAAGQMESEAARQFADASADLEQAQAQGVELEVGGRTEALDQPVAKGMQQPVGSGMQQQPELVGPEAVVVQVIGLQRILEILDPVLGLTAIDVPVVDGQWIIGTSGDHEAVLGPLAN